MINELLLGGSVAIVSGLLGFAIAKKLASANYRVYVEKAKAKAIAIEHEAELLLERSKLRAQELEHEAALEFDKVEKEVRQSLRDDLDALEVQKKSFAQVQHEQNERIAHEYRSAKAEKLQYERLQKSLEKSKKECELKYQESMHILQSASGLTKQELKEQYLKRIEEDAREEKIQLVRRYETEAKSEARRKANYILAQATSRYASEFASERLVNQVHLADNELKGRIIGKEGRNIKTLELLLGVDIIVDETPNAIIVSSFNIYRRAIATKTLQLLIEDGRIHPGRIEEIHAKVSEEFDEEVVREAEHIVMDLGIGIVQPELLKLLGKLRYRASFGQNALAHTLEVAHLAGIMAAEMGGNVKLAKRAGLLHDIGKALTYDFEGSHVDLGADICKRLGEDEVVINAIYAHHDQEPIKSIECAAVCAADALSAARPGARREALENFTKRVEEIEEIASLHPGVRQVYAINAGREVRVFVNAELVNDDESILLSKEIAKELEANVQFAGTIKVTVIRELRAIEYAS